MNLFLWPDCGAQKAGQPPYSFARRITHPFVLTVHIIKHSPWPLGQHLKRVLRAQRHHRKHVINKLIWHVLMEHVAHGVDKYAAWLLPVQWDRQPLRVTEDLSEWSAGSQAWPHAFGVAVFASLAHLRATRH